MYTMKPIVVMMDTFLAAAAQSVRDQPKVWHSLSRVSPPARTCLSLRVLLEPPAAPASLFIFPPAPFFFLFFIWAIVRREKL